MVMLDSAISVLCFIFDIAVYIATWICTLTNYVVITSSKLPLICVLRTKISALSGLFCFLPSVFAAHNKFRIRYLIIVGYKERSLYRCCNVGAINCILQEV